ncbi:hypothetical protein PTKIN_Ptkin09bG0128900 [Pterospermum kingtungense]
MTLFFEQIAINIYGCNMDKNHWIWENPEEWIPKKFLDEKYDLLDLHKTLAFGAGKKVCAIGRLAQEFEWRSKGGAEEKVDTVGLTFQRLYPLLAILKPRSY